MEVFSREHQGKCLKSAGTMPKNPGHVIADLVVVDDATLQHLGQLSNLQMVGVEPTPREGGGLGTRVPELSKKYESKLI